MTTASLKDIEKSLKLLWTNKSAREQFISGSVPSGVSEEIAGQIDISGVNLYASLMRIGQNDLMDSVYPICAHLIGKGFHDLVAKYYEEYPPDHYNFNKGAQRFSQFLKVRGDRYVKKYPFLPDLADYEWLELEVMESPAVIDALEDVTLDSPELFDKFAPVVNPTLAIRKYSYPVSKVVDWVKEDVKLPRRVKRGSEILAVYRLPETNQVRFLELGANACKIIEASIESRTSYSELIKLIVESSQNADPHSMVIEFLQLIETYRELKVFVGSAEVS